MAKYVIWKMDRFVYLNTEWPLLFTYRQRIDIPKQICLRVRRIRSAIQLHYFPRGILVLVPFNVGITFGHRWSKKEKALMKFCACTRPPPGSKSLRIFMTLRQNDTRYSIQFNKKEEGKFLLWLSMLFERNSNFNPSFLIAFQSNLFVIAFEIG